MQFQTNKIRASTKPAIVVDFGGTKIAAALVENGRIIKRQSGTTDQSATPAEHVVAMAGLVKELLIDVARESTGKVADVTAWGNESALQLEELNIGVAASGRIDRNGMWHALNDRTFPSLKDFPLRERLQSLFTQPVSVMNDAAAAAWGEYSVIEQNRPQNFLYLTVSTGVGGGLILNGLPQSSADGMAGHLGFMTSGRSPVPCSSGRVGTLESVASGTAIGIRGNGDKSRNCTGRDIYERHLLGDKDASRAVHDSAAAIADAIANMRAALGIDQVALGGGIGLAQGYIGLVQEYLSEEPDAFQPELKRASLGTDSALIGMASLMTQVHTD